MQVLFISDLHLGASSREITACFLDFCREIIREKNVIPAKAGTEALYILGDLFEAWVGDDENASWLDEIGTALKNLSDNNIKLYFMRGNRDFLLGKRWAEKCGAVLLPDPVLINLYNIPTLLTHGDILCTEDKNYQRWRKFSHHSLVQKLFLMLPLKFRQNIANSLRKESRKYTKNLAGEKMDVSISAVENMVREYQVTQIIHGHTHRPAVHTTATYRRYVLPDWHPKGGVLVVKPGESPELCIF